MNQMIAYCGLTCTDCPAYQATQANDQEALENVAAAWRELFNRPEITADNILCDGCIVDGRKSGYCSTCDIRPCARERGVETCALCADYESCEHLTEFHTHAPEAKALLDKMRAAL
jgi:hypothetical protein